MKQVGTAKFPNFLRAWQNLGVVYYRLGEFERTIPAHTRVLELGAGNSDTYGLLGYAHASVGNHIAAESAFRMAVLLASDLARCVTGQFVLADAGAHLSRSRPYSAE